MPDLDALAAEFGLGRLTGADPVPGHPHVVTITTERGTFLARPAGPAEPALYEQVARTLARAGIRQAMPLRSTAGSLVSAAGLTVQEFLPGTTYTAPSAAQTLATMRHIAAYHAALRPVPFPPAQPTMWTQVAEPSYLLTELPRLLPPLGLRLGLGLGLGDAVEALLGRLDAALPLISALPRQLVHGDIGPDNVLMDGDEVVAIIDFTPHRQPVLFAVATAIYWYHVHGQVPGPIPSHGPRPGHVPGASLDTAAIGASLNAAGPWTSAERAAWPAMLAREALRRLATPFALAAESKTPLSGGHTAVSRRLDAVAAIARDWTLLATDPTA